LDSSSSSSSDRSDPSGVVAEGIGDEDVEIDAAEAVSDAENVAAEVNSADESTTSSASSGGEGVVAGTSTEEDVVSMDELEAAEASFDNTLIASASSPRPAEKAVDEHTTVGVVTNAVRAVETTPITITNSGGTAQGNPSGSGNHADPSLFDSSPSTRHYVQRARRGSMVSIDSKRTVLATVRVPTPPSPLHESGGTAPTPVIIAAVVSAAATVQESETIPVATEEIPGSEEVPIHISDIPEGNNIVESIPIDENLVVSTEFGTGVTHVEHAEVVAGEDPIQTDVIPGSGIPIMEEAFVQDPAYDISMEDMADTHDSYNAILAKTEDHVAGTQAANLDVATPVTVHTSPTKTGNWFFINILLFSCLMAEIS
jgi:hypothetical protein